MSVASENDGIARSTRSASGATGRSAGIPGWVDPAIPDVGTGTTVAVVGSTSSDGVGAEQAPATNATAITLMTARVRTPTRMAVPSRSPIAPLPPSTVVTADDGSATMKGD